MSIPLIRDLPPTRTQNLDLDVPIADVSAADLRLHINRPAPPLLATLTLPEPAERSAADSQNLTMRLAIIGASHVVDLSRIEEQSPFFREELSCSSHSQGEEIAAGVHKKTTLPTWQSENPNSTSPNSTELRYDVDIETKFVTAEEFAQQAQWLLTRSEEGWLVRRFPGEGEFHVTALFGDMRGEEARVQAQWRTWHLYPEENAIVESASKVTWCPVEKDTTQARLGGGDV